MKFLSSEKWKRKPLLRRSDKIALGGIGLFAFLTLGASPVINEEPAEPPAWEDLEQRLFPVQAVDTMKYSRDTAGAKLEDPSFDTTINEHVQAIAELGATHVAVGTPYDEQFVPFLERWVQAARKHNLSVWFRGNLAGWERWFGYERITQTQHIEKIRQFILQNPQLFEDGDIFTSCPECENGGPGDPRRTGKVQEFRDFLIQEHQTAQAAFQEIDKNVTVGFYSMNGDVARLVMNEATTNALGNTVAIDHYVASPKRFANDIAKYATESRGNVAIGEIGGPIPDIHGSLTETEQAELVDAMMQSIWQNKEHIAAVNYWVLAGGSTTLLNNDGSKRQAYYALQQYFTPFVVQGTVRNGLGEAVAGLTVQDTQGNTVAHTDEYGRYRFLVPQREITLTVGGLDYTPVNLVVAPSQDTVASTTSVVEPTTPDILYQLRLRLAELQGAVQKLMRSTNSEG